MVLREIILLLFVVCVATEEHGQQFITDQYFKEHFISNHLVELISAMSNPDVIPQTSIGIPIEVEVGLSLIGIKEVNQRRNEVEIDVWASLHWNSRIRWAPSRFNNLSDVRMPVSKIWVPDMAVYNGELSFLETMSHGQVVITDDGGAIWIPQTRLRVTCEVGDDVIRTNATCDIKIGSWAYNGKQISIKDDPKFDINDYVPNSKYDMLGVSAKKEVKYYPCCPEPYPNTRFTFSFRKN